MVGTALEGVKIIEYCRNTAGAYCAKLMADMGAEVIKIEDPEKGDPSRSHPPFPGDTPHPEKSGLFLYLNTNKLGITLNLVNPSGKRLFKALAKEADILIEDYPVGEMAALGLGYSALKKHNRGLIVASITPFGQTGPHKNHKAYKLNVSHVSGQGYLLPIPATEMDRAPVQLGGNASSYDAGLTASIAIMAALYHKGATGSGQYIDISEQEALMSINRLDIETFPNFGESATREGMLKRRQFGGTMPCKDGYIFVLVPEEHQWHALVKMMDDPEWAKEEWCKDRESRREHHLEIKQRIAEWMKSRTREEIYKKGQAVSCPVAPICSPKEVLDSRQFNAREFFVEMNHPVAGGLNKFPGAPYRFSKTPWRINRPAPCFGEHNETVYIKRLGLSQTDLDELKKSKAV